MFEASFSDKALCISNIFSVCTMLDILFSWKLPPLAESVKTVRPDLVSETFCSKKKGCTKHIRYSVSKYLRKCLILSPQKSAA